MVSPQYIHPWQGNPPDLETRRGALSTKEHEAAWWGRFFVLPAVRLGLGPAWQAVLRC